MAIISFGDKAESVWGGAGWAFRQILRDLSPYAQGNPEFQAALEQAGHIGSLVVDIVDKDLAGRITFAMASMCSEIIEGRRQSSIDNFHSDRETRDLYRKELELLRSAVSASTQVHLSMTENPNNLQRVAGEPAISRQHELLRAGKLTVSDISDFAAEAGRQNYIEAETDVNALLDHDDSIVRYNALATLAYEWGRTPRIDRIRDILLTDPDSDCRRQAAGALGSLFRGQQRRDVLDLLASVVKNSLEDHSVRIFAYTGALDVIGVSRALQPNPGSLEVGPNELLALDDYLKTIE